MPELVDVSNSTFEPGQDTTSGGFSPNQHPVYILLCF